MPENLAAVVIFVGIIAYTVFGGADFGGGVWVVLASGPRASRQREAIVQAMAPVWETNHVWLIFIVVTLFTLFPSAFADLFTALRVPLVVVLIGVMFRGAAFGFRYFGHHTPARLPAMMHIFSVASIVTPAAMGVTLGAVAGGHINIEDGVVTSGLFETWLKPFPIMYGLIGVASCAFLNAYYMANRTSDALQEDFRKRGLIACLTLGILTIIALPVAYWSADAFWGMLVAWAPLVLLGCAVAMGLASVLVLWQRRYTLAPPVAAGTVALLIAVWGVAQYPFVIVPSQRIADIAAESNVITLVLVTIGIGAVILTPSITWLYVTFNEKTEGSGP